MNNLLFASLLAAAAPAFAAPPVAAFFDAPNISHVKLSPKGNYVAFLRNAADGKQLVVVRDTRDLDKYTVPGGTDSEHAFITSVHWINENRIGFTVKDRRVEFEGNLDEFAADRDGNNLTHLISGNWRHRTERTGSHLQSRTLTADYGYWGPTHDGSDDIIVQKYLWNNVDLTPESSRLYRLNTRTRQLSDMLPGAMPGRVQRWLVDADAAPRIAVSVDKGRCIVSYRDKDAAAWSELANSPCLGNTSFIPAFFDSRNTLYVTASHKGHTALFSYDLAKRQRSAEPVVSAEGFDYRGHPELDYVAKSTLGLHLETDAQSTVWFDPAMKEVQRKVDTLLPGLVNLIHCGNDCRNATALLIESSSDRQPRQYLVYTPATGKLISLGSEHPDIVPAQMGRRDFQRFKARDGMQIPVYVTLPPGQAKGPFPTVVLVHGGPYVRGGSWEWDDEAQFLASRGYVVLQPEFRGSTGFGYRHFEAGWKQWGRAMQDDLADTAQWAVQQGWSDPRRIAIMGASYGGYASLMGLIRHPQIFRCAVDLSGPSDIGMLFTVVQSDASREALQYGMKTLLGDPDAEEAALREVSPLAQAAKLTQPVLIAHGAEDVRVPLVHATRLRSALKHNPGVEYVVYPEEGHALRRPADRHDFYKRVEAFLAANLK